MKRTYTLALALILVVFAVVMTSCVMATNSDTDSTSASSATLEPTEEDVTPVTTRVDSTTIEVEPLEVPATTVDSTTPTTPTPTTPWPYIPVVAGAATFVAVALVALSLRRRGHKFSWPRLLSSLLLISLLAMTATPVYGQEELAVSIWDLSGIAPTWTYFPLTSRDSVDSAGNVWFGQYAVNKISFLNPSTNEIKMWTLPEPGSVALMVFVDDADNVWFPDTSHHRIGRLNPTTNFFTIWPVSGIEVTEWEIYVSMYPYHIQFFVSSWISFDIDGNIYFSEPIKNKIGRLNPSTNEVTEWSIPTNDSCPSHTLVDLSGNVWFVEYLGNKIAKLNPGTNEITEWSIPTLDSKPLGIYVAEGQVYFAGRSSGKIGRLNPSTNEVTEWSLHVVCGGYGLLGIFVDSKGNVWSMAPVTPQKYYGLPWGYYCYGSALSRLGSDNILTYWIIPNDHFGFRIGSNMFTVDTKVNLGDVYIVTGFTMDTWPTDKNAILRFHSAAA